MIRFERSRLVAATVAALCILSLKGTDSFAQTVSPATPSAVAVSAFTGVQDPSPAATSDEASSAQFLPMSMRPFYHVFAAFGGAWLLVLVYAISLRRRLATLERDVERLTR